MAQKSWNNVTLRSAGTFAPNANGWDFSALPPASAVSVSLALQSADENDSSLTIDVRVEFTTDPTGATGWTEIVGGVWQGGPHGRAGVATQPSYGPFSTTNWPEIKRLRFAAVPSRDVSSVDGSITAF